MTQQIHRVSRGPKHVPLVLPKDAWHGGTFVEADGTVLEVQFSGRHMPASDIERGMAKHRKRGHPVEGGG